MSMQRLYWQDMINLKRDARYVDLWLASTEVTDRYIKAGLAIAASSSIGGWLIFKQYAFIWASVVAVSQVVQAIKEYLPYKSRLKALASLSQDLNSICLSAENHWYQVSSGALYDDDIHHLRFDLKARTQAAVQKAFPLSGLPENDVFFEKAQKETALYFAVYLEQGDT